MNKHVADFYNKVIKQVQQWTIKPENVAREIWRNYYNAVLEEHNLTHNRLYLICKRAWRDTSVISWESYKNAIEYIIKKNIY